MGNQIIYSSAPVTDVSSEIGKHFDFVYAVASIQGWRKKQEDAYKVIIDFHEGLSYFAVFDGHGGSEISEFLKIQLHNYIKGFLMEHDDVELALHLGFLSCDSSLRDPEVKAVLNAMIEAENDVATRMLKSQFLGVASDSSCIAGPSFETLRNRLTALNPHGFRGLGPYGDGPSSSEPYGLGPRGDGPSGNDGPDGNLSSLAKPSGDGPDGNLPSLAKPSGDGPDGNLPSLAKPSGDGPTDASGGPSGDATSGSSGAGPVPIGADLGPYGDGAGPSQGVPISRPGTEDILSIQYLLNEELESSDSEDADFDVEDEWSSSESTDEEMPLDAEAILTQEPADLSGSTATIALLGKSKIYVANVGDSRCVLSRNGQAIDMSLDHNPHNPEELLRIKNAGGTVSADGRVNNLINLSRAFGDFKLKGPSHIPAEQCITAEPFIKSIDIQKEDDFLVIASDGIWNSFTSQGLIDYLNIRIKAEDSSLTAICEEIFKFVIPPKLSDDGTGCDNMTLLIIKLHANESSFFIDADSESMDVFSSAESETDCEDAPTDLDSMSNQEQPSSSTEVGSTSNVEKPTPTEVDSTPTEVDSTSNEVDSTSTENQPAPLQHVPVINLEDPREIEIVDLDP